MWIGSHTISSARRPIVSPPGYQSPVLGDCTPVPGSQGTPHSTPISGVTSLSLSRVPRWLTPVVPQPRTHLEVVHGQPVSQWWGHRGLHQREVPECLTTEETQQVSTINAICRLTTISRLPAPSRPRMDGTSTDNPTRPSLARTPAASKGNNIKDDLSEPSLARASAAFEGSDTDDDSSSSITLVSYTRSTSSSVNLSRPNDAPTAPVRPSLPPHTSYAQQPQLCLNYSVKEEPPPENGMSSGTLIKFT
ncbi:uncharacterized protein LACBIDRAFT_335219 [Laccaria bicolor S238N-H82]|uniref:Predicted protein n=1 Tax=Laccaria bicolor (strain S238N-H82 / ATCC MYA-4686) TaxID=486041 RepID=B0E1Q6_LACBS|nr:uncharacterized protein LACBIDRAFT_335219 [Laccaria bicolor S238N-H82]EDQ99215.1 predicted protein [Laccaria bicolor S238N-H82]|eukprot:XP_001890112.1 predicted protein [Laccaria bicolor S238N-H82]